MIRLVHTIVVILACAMTFPALANPAETESAGELLDQVLSKPGAWNQMCSAMPLQKNDQIPLFGYWRNPNFFISEANFTQLRNKRAAVLPEISDRLHRSVTAYADDPSCGPGPLLFPNIKGDTESDGLRSIRVGLDGTSPLDEYLVIVLDLNGVEVLPALLAVEKAYHRTAKYPAPKVPGLDIETEGAAFYSGQAGPSRMHTRVLSVITALLLNEQYPRFLESKVYKTYTNDYGPARARIAADDPELGKLVSSDVPKSTSGLIDVVIRRDRDMRNFDGLMYLSYDKSTRDEIISIAAQFVREVSPDKYVGAAAMSERPYYR